MGSTWDICALLRRGNAFAHSYVSVFFSLSITFGRNTVAYPLLLKSTGIHLLTFVSGRWGVKQNVGPATTPNEDKPESPWRALFSFQVVCNQTAEGLVGISGGDFIHLTFKGVNFEVWPWQRYVLYWVPFSSSISSLIQTISIDWMDINIMFAITIVLYFMPCDIKSIAMTELDWTGWMSAS